jgi:hypothetical protein
MRPESSDETSNETTLALWGGVDLDLDLKVVHLKRCACGAPAVAATRRLDEQERTYHCQAHLKARGTMTPPGAAER